MCKGSWGTENGLTVKGIICHAEKYEHEQKLWKPLKQEMFTSDNHMDHMFLDVFRDRFEGYKKGVRGLS